MRAGRLTVVIGGTRSGKSRIAESLLESDPAVTYIATGPAEDLQMRTRIAEHRQRRPAGWLTVETTEVAHAISEAIGSVLVDSVGTWVAARMDAMQAWDDGDLEGLIADAASWRDRAGGHLVVVAEQVGAGVLPMGEGTRRWVDTVGAVTQALVDGADEALLVVAGRAIPLPRATPPPRAPTPSVGVRVVGEPEAGEDLDLLHQHGDRMVPAEALDLAVNVQGGAPPPHIRDAIAGAAVGVYPSQDEAREVIAGHHGISPDNVVLLAGAAEAFWLLPHALRPSRAAIVHPTFTAPEAALRQCGVEVLRVPRDAAAGWRLRPDQVPDDVDMVVVGNPNNPTGTLDEPSDLVGLCRPGRVVVVDEAFMDFVADGRSSLAGAVRDRDLVVLRSMTKLWSVPGVRAGYLTAPDHLAATLRAHQQPWPVSTAALAVTVAAITDQRFRLEVADGVAARRTDMVRQLAQVAGVTVHDGAANFILIEVAGGPHVHRALLARGIAVRPSTFPLLPSSHLRVTVRGAEATERLVAALQEIL